MIKQVSYTDSEFNLPPLRFEGWHTAIAGSTGFIRRLILCINSIAGAGNVSAATLAAFGAGLQQINNCVTIVGQPAHRQGVVSIVLAQAHHHDVCQLLDAKVLPCVVGITVPCHC